MRSKDDLAVESSKGDTNSAAFPRLLRLVLADEKLEVVQMADVDRRRVLIVPARDWLSSARRERRRASPEDNAEGEHVDVEPAEKRGDGGRIRRSRSVPDDVGTRVALLDQATDLHNMTVARETSRLHRFVVRLEANLAKDLRQ